MRSRFPLAPVRDLLRKEPNARRFFLVQAQSSLGNGAAYVGLLVLAYERFPSPWAITLILLADVLVPMAAGPLFGAAATAGRTAAAWCWPMGCGRSPS